MTSRLNSTTKESRTRATKLGLVIAVALLPVGVSGALTVNISPSFSQLPQAVAILLLMIGVLGASRIRLPRYVRVPLLVFFLLSALATVVSLFTTSLEFALRGFVGLTAGLGAMLAAATACINTDEQRVARTQNLIGLSLAIVAIISGLWALRQALLGFSPAELFAIQQQASTFAVGGQIRASGTFIVNQEFGSFTAAAVPALLVLTMRADRHRWLYGTAFVLLSTATVLAMLRSPIVAALIASVLAVLLYAPGKHVVSRLVSSLLLITAITATAFWFFSNSTDPRIRAAVEHAETLLAFSDDYSFNERTDRVWVRALELMTQHPFGLGAGSAGPTSEKFPEVAPAGRVITDNGYLMIGVQLGWLGAIVFVWVLVAILVFLRTSSTAWAGAGTVALIALLIAMTASGFWSLFAGIVLVGSIIGVGLADASKNLPALHSDAPLKMRNRIPLVHEQKTRLL